MFIFRGAMEGRYYGKGIDLVDQEKKMSNGVYKGRSITGGGGVLYCAGPARKKIFRKLK